MAKSKKLQDTIGDYHEEKFRKESLSENMTNNMMKYAGQAFKRAIPDVRDGLIEVRRRVIWTMHKDAKLSSTSKHMKVAKVAGLTLGYHPHGDKSVSDATTNMSQPWNLNAPLVDIEGNNGSTLNRDFAAGRYIESRMTKYSENMVGGINQNAVDMVTNFDNTALEPEVLPASFPQMLVNGMFSSGMAVGFSSLVAPHNIVEATQAAELVNRKPNVSLDEIMKIIPGPCLPTGNIVMGTEGIKELYETGKGRFAIQPRHHIEDRTIVIDEVPFGVTREELIGSIVNAINNGGIEHLVKSVTDESAGGGESGDDEEIRIAVELEKGASVDSVLALLIKKSKLQIFFNAQHVALVDGMPETLPLKTYLEHFVNFRRETMRRVFEKEHADKSARKHIVEGFIAMIDIADEVIATIRKSDGKQASADAIEKEFGFSPEQAMAIVSMQLYRISRQDLQQLQRELKDLEDRIAFLDKILGDDKELRKEVSKDLKKTVREFKNDARDEHATQIRDEVKEVKINQSELNKAQDTCVVIKPYGIQRMTRTVFDNNKEKYPGIIVSEIDTDTNHAIALLTKNGKVMQRIAGEVDNTSVRNDPADLRMSTSTFESGDEIITAVAIDPEKIENSDLSVISVTARGQVKHSQLSKSFLSFNNKGYLTRTKPYNGLKIDGDHIIAAVVVATDDVANVKFNLKRTTGGRITTVDMSAINEQGPTGGGVSKVKTKDDETVTITKHNFDDYALAQYIE